MAARPAPVRVLVLGGGGMLGHRVWSAALARSDVDAMVTVHGPVPPRTAAVAFPPDRVLAGVDALDLATLERALDATRPEVVINAIGVVKQLDPSRDPSVIMAVNAELPHRLAETVRAPGARLIHLSTDCVFAGDRGAYTEDDPPDATDLYGRSKAAGEPSGDQVLTVRTSMIGRELSSHHGLLDWFLGAGPSVAGYTRARFSGLSTPVLADVLLDVAVRHPGLHGTVHLAGPAITKYDLLVLARRAFARTTRIVPAAEPVIDRTLDGSRFAAQTGFVAPDWATMVEALAADTAAYDQAPDDQVSHDQVPHHQATE